MMGAVRQIIPKMALKILTEAGFRRILNYHNHSPALFMVGFGLLHARVTLLCSIVTRRTFEFGNEKPVKAPGPGTSDGVPWDVKSEVQVIAWVAGKLLISLISSFCS
jgi:hypothetical protein